MHNLWCISDIDELIKLAAGLGIHVSDSLATNLFTVYEWEYKYFKIAQSNIFERRKDNLLRLIVEDMQPVYQAVLAALIDTYSSWIIDHDTDNVEQMSKSRVQEVINLWEDEGHYEELSPLIAAESEYNRYIGAGNFEYDFISDNQAALQGLIQQFLAIDIDDIKTQLESNEDPDLQEQLNYLESYDLSTPDSIQEYINTYYESLQYFINSATQYGHLSNDDYAQMLTNFWANTIVPSWKDNWEDQGLSDVLEQNKAILQALQNVDTSDFGNTNATINMALNGVHITGSMIDHIQEKYDDVDQELLSQLSNIDTTQWDEDLKYYGA